MAWVWLVGAKAWVETSKIWYLGEPQGDYKFKINNLEVDSKTITRDQDGKITNVTGLASTDYRQLLQALRIN